MGCDWQRIVSFSDDPKMVSEVCGKCCGPFLPGCIFTNGSGLVSFDHPLHKVKEIAREDNEGHVYEVVFKVDLYTRKPSIPRTASSANWADAILVQGE
ncbi:hypothetical protein GIB67_021212 [Kingdonia uniflora]|uniref:DUF3700 domain-containing protein n=1 Tax=Kingdonia uniflora TaxID=39325 RepID=A0A7J7LFF9_9MAGN|nr:hypothetical protein GIB67_021212 [Kingdonia uniflora]